ncbi:MAG TPA: VOC family protein [Pirellulales bacterium]|jgi:methylmalonyl-CoA epimerase
MPIFERLDHVSIGVVDLERALRLFVDVLGAEPLPDRGETPAESFRWATFKLGGKKLELVSPTTPGEGGVGRYIARHGEGFHHLSISVADLPKAIVHFESHGIRVLAANFENPLWKHCYLHPQDTCGALIQVFEENEKTLSEAG